MKNYFQINPVARQYSEYDAIFENEKVDELMKKIADVSLDIFKRTNFDLAPKKDRKLKTMRLKLSDIANSGNGLELLSKVKDYSEDNDLADGKYSEAKDLYMDALDSFISAIKSAESVSKEKGKVFVERAKENARKIQGALNDIASKMAREMNANESDFVDGEYPINEALLVGYSGRVKRLRERLNDLVSSAEGKGNRNGYSKDWKRIFLELSQKLSAIDTSRDGTGSKDKDVLAQLEKDADRYQKEFNKAVITATERELKNIENDTELKGAYSDVVDHVTKALDNFSTGSSAQETAENQLKDEMEERESKFNENIFPVRVGSKDTDDKFNDSHLIANIQRGLMNGVNIIDTFLKDKGGADGKYGNATASVVAALQKQSGNKNANGELDRQFLDVILASDFIGPDDRKDIVASLDKLKEKNVHESAQSRKDRVLSMGAFLRGDKLNEAEEKLRLDKSMLNADIENFYSDLKGKAEMDSNTGSRSVNSKNLAEKVAKSLRKGGISIEGDSFLKDDESLKKKYSEDFLKAWGYAIENAKDGEDFFFYDGGLYYMKNKAVSKNVPANFPKWKEIAGDDSDDASDFMKNYAKSFKTIGGMNREVSSEVIDEFYSKIGKIDDFDLSGVFETIKTAVNTKNPYISLDDLKGKIAKAINIVIQDNEAQRGDQDMGIEDFLGLNNILVMTAGMFTYDGERFTSASAWIRKNVLTDDAIKRINEDGYYSSWNPVSHGPILYIDRSKKGGISMISKGGLGPGKSVRKYLGSTMYELFADVPTNDKYAKLPTSVKQTFSLKGMIDTHIKRINADNFSEVPQPNKNGAIEVNEDDIKE